MARLVRSIAEARVIRAMHCIVGKPRKELRLSARCIALQHHLGRDRISDHIAAWESKPAAFVTLGVLRDRGK